MNGLLLTTRTLLIDSRTRVRNRPDVRVLSGDCYDAGAVSINNDY